jgi:hypothetical protein
MREAALGGDILPWRDVLHDGPVPAGLSLSELSRVRATYLATQGAGDVDELIRSFGDRDAMLERYGEYDAVVLWFEWDLYDQLQLLQLLDFFAGKSENVKLPPLDIVSFAGYLGTIPAERFRDLYAKREPVSKAMLSLGRQAWNAVTASDPCEIWRTMKGDTSALPFLDGALRRFLEELPWRTDGLSRAERQLLQGMSNGPASFGEIFRHATDCEERVWCGDLSAASYLERLGRGDSPLVAFRMNENAEASIKVRGPSWIYGARLTLTESGRDVLACKKDWIELGGSDRWLGGVHLDDGAAAWRWNAVNGIVEEAGRS